MNFKVGDVVMLKSGGERKTIKKIEGEDAVCVSESQGIPRETIYPLACLAGEEKAIRNNAESASELIERLSRNRDGLVPQSKLHHVG